MFTRFAVLSLVWAAAGVGAGTVAVAQANPGSTDTATSATPPGALTMPAEVRGYKLTKRPASPDDKGALRYQYARHDADVITVSITPYPSDTHLRASDDTVDLMMKDVGDYYDAIYLKHKRGEILELELEHVGESDLQTGHGTLRAASMWAKERPIGAPGEFATYYAAFALPTRVVDVQANLGWRVGRFEEVGVFARYLVTNLANQRELAQGQQ